MINNKYNVILSNESIEMLRLIYNLDKVAKGDLNKLLEFEFEQFVQYHVTQGFEDNVCVRFELDKLYTGDVINNFIMHRYLELGIKSETILIN